MIIITEDEKSQSQGESQRKTSHDNNTTPRSYSSTFHHQHWVDIRPRRWSIFQSDGMVNVLFQATIEVNGFSMVLTTLDHHH